MKVFLNKSLKSKALIVLLALLSALCFYFGAEQYKTNASEQGVFAFDNGAEIKDVDPSKIQENGDTTAIRFRVEINKDYVDENGITSIKSSATMGGVEILNTTIDNVVELVADGSYCHYFYFANIPSSHYSEQILVKSTAISNQTEMDTITVSRSIEYVASVGIYKAIEHVSDLYKYAGNGDTLYSNSEEKTYTAGEMAQVELDNFDGCALQRVYLNGNLCSDTSLLITEQDSNIVKVDTSKLGVLQSHFIVAITENNDIIAIDNFYVAESVASEEITLTKANAFRLNDTSEITVELDNSYSIKEIIIDDKDASLDFAVSEKLITINNAKEYSTGEHVLTAKLNNNDILTIPIFLYDRFEIDSPDDFIAWRTVCVKDGTWDSENSVGNRHTYAILKNNIDLDGVSQNIDYYKDSCASGVFDGQGYSIKNFNIASDALFYRTSNFIMKNVGFIKSTFSHSVINTTPAFMDFANSSSTKLINCYFEICQNPVGAVPFLNSSALDLVEDVIIKTSLSARNVTCVFNTYNPKSIKNSFVIGKNLREGKENDYIPILNGENIPQDCGSYQTISEFIQNADKSGFDTNYWDFSKTDDTIWKTA